MGNRPRRALTGFFLSCPSNEGCGRGSRRSTAAGACGVALLMVAPVVSAATWTLRPTLSVQETYTDNVRLSVPGTEQSDFITQVSPGFTLSGVGGRIRLNAAYSLQERFYLNNSSANGRSNVLSAQASAEVIPRAFFVDATAGITQANISALGVQGVDNTTISANRTDIKQMTLTPHYHGRLGDFASYEARYTLQEQRASGNGASLDNQSQSLALRLNSGTGFARLGWGVTYSTQHIDYQSATDTDFESLQGTLRYSVDPHLQFTASVGQDHNSYSSVNRSSGAFRSVGAVWSPSSLTRLQASLGRRFYGPTRQVNFEHRSRFLTWTLGYNDDVTSTAQEFLRPVAFSTASLLDARFRAEIPDAALRAQAINDFIRLNNLPATVPGALNFFTNQIFLQKSLTGSVGYDYSQHTILLTAYRTQRDSLSTSGVVGLGVGDFTFSTSTVQTGTNVLWNWRLAPRTRANVNYALSRLATGGREDDSKTFQVGLSHQFQPKVDGSVGVRRVSRVSNTGGNDYSENGVNATVQVRF